MRTPVKTIICLIPVIFILLSCNAPPNPYTDRNNIRNFVTVEDIPQDGWVVGDTVKFLLWVRLDNFVDSVRFDYGDGNNRLVGSDSLSDNGTISITHVYTAPGNFTVATTIYENNGNTKSETHEPLMVKTHIRYLGNGNTGGNVPVDSALYAKGDRVIVLTNTDSLARTGYTLKGWNTKPDGSGTAYDIGTKYTIDTVNVLYAEWSQNSVYSVMFDKNDSTATGTMAAQSIASGLSENLTRNGFVKPGSLFAGWSATAAGTVMYPDGASYLMGTANVTLYARWTQNTLYTVTFIKNDSSALGTMAAQPIASGASANLTANSFTKPGSIFSGWATTPAGTVAYTDTATYLMGTANVTLYAKWTQNASYTVTFNKNDTAATGTMAAQTITSGSSANLTPNRYAKTGWFFAGWATTPTGAVSFTDAVSYVMGTANVTLYAKWTQNPVYTVTFDKNDTNATGTMTAQSIASGSSANLTTNKFAKIGWTFSGWAATATGAVAYTDGASYQMGNAPVTMYAKWTQNASYTVTFDKNDTSATGSMSAQPIVSGLTANLTTNRFAKTGWTFSGWATTSAGAVAYTDGASYQMGSANVTLYAKWTQNASYTITFNKNDTAATGTMVAQTIVSGSSANLTTNGYTRTGWVFAGWAATPTGAVVYTDGTTYLMGSANITLYAKWTQNPMFTITYVKNDTSATGTMAPQSIVSGTSVTLTVNGYAKAGYAFAGWATTPTGTVAYADQASYAMGSANVTLYAKWTVNSYTIAASVSGTGGTIAPSGSVSVVYGRDTTFTITPAAGFTIQNVLVDGVADAVAKTTKQKTFTNVTTGHTITVTFAPKQFTLSTNMTVDVGSVTGTITQNPAASLYDSGTTVTLVAPVDNKYNFTGWTGSMTGAANSIDVVMNGTKTMTANYAIKKCTLAVTINPIGGGTVALLPAISSYTSVNGTTSYSCTIGSSVLLTANPSTGYSAGNWIGGANGAATSPATVQMNGNINITATFARIYTVTFNSQGATVAATPATKTVTQPATTVITLPTPPTRTGFVFDGWWTGMFGNGTSFTADIGVSQDVTVYAKWIVKDRDGNIYDTVKIGNQMWLKQNLKTTKFNNGAGIYKVTDAGWSTSLTPAYCWYNNDSLTYGTIYGALYNWYTVDAGNLAPAGWHVPTDAEWTTLTTYLGGEGAAGGKLKATTLWNTPNTGATNETGFTALPGGYRGNSGSFSSIGSFAGWWSASSYDASNAWNRSIYNSFASVWRDYSNAYSSGYSVRCVHD